MASLAELRAGREAVEDLLRRLGVVAKRLDLSTAAGFDRAVDALAARLRGTAAGAERAAVRAAVDGLDVDWARTSLAERRALVSAAMARAGKDLALVPTRIQADLGDAAHEVVATTRSWARRTQRLAIGVEPNAADARMVRFAVRSQALFVTDQHGRRLDALGERLRAVVGRGLAEGRDRTAIAAELQAAAATTSQ